MRRPGYAELATPVPSGDAHGSAAFAHEPLGDGNVITEDPRSASPAITSEQRTKTNCQKFCTKLESNRPAPSMSTPRTRCARPP